MCQYYDHIIAYMKLVLTTGNNSLPSADDGTDQDIERILEAKGMIVDEETELKRQYEIFKRIRREP